MTKFKIQARYSYTQKKWLVVRAISEDELRARRNRDVYWPSYAVSQMERYRQEDLNRQARSQLEAIRLATPSFGRASMAQAAHGGLGGVGALHGLHIPPE